MSFKFRKVLGIAVLIMAAFGAATLIFGRPEILFDRTNSKAPATPHKSLTAQSNGKAKSPQRNLSLQPQAFNLSRRLGRRFSPGKLGKSVLFGTLTIGSNQQVVQTARTQTDDGEEVEIRIGGSAGSLTWEKSRGGQSQKGPASGSDRELIERLVFDSPDQFVLAQLRGASYQTVARGVRPEGADDNYSGPLWDVVRVNDPETDADKRPISPWRLYYLNTRTGLIERIISDLQGERILAEIGSWVEVNGEQVPAQITWKRQGQIIMQFRLTNFSHAQH